MHVTWTDLHGVCHGLTHVNKEKLAARSECGHYLDFRRGQVDDDGVVSCIACIAAPPLLYYEDRQAEIMVNARKYDTVRRCVNHFEVRHADGTCMACGYALVRSQTHAEDY